MTIWQICICAPRSTIHHCGSEKALDQRVPAFPSFPAEAGLAAFSTEEALAGLLRAALAVPQLVPVPMVPITWNSHSE